MSEKLGIGAMLSLLGGNAESVKAYQGAVGKTITSLALDPDAEKGLRVGLGDGSVVEFYDDARSCCETRFMKCDDDLPYYIGAALESVSPRSGPREDKDYGVSECAFLVVRTSKGEFTVASYNEHNGYYGGISLMCRLIPAKEEA